MEEPSLPCRTEYFDLFLFVHGINPKYFLSWNEFCFEPLLIQIHSHIHRYQSVYSLKTIMKCDKMQIYLSSNLKLNLSRISLKSELVEDHISTTSLHVSGSMFCSLSLFSCNTWLYVFQHVPSSLICSHKTDKKTFDLKYVF